MSDYRISDDILKKIDDETDIVALVGEFVSLEKSGKNYKGLCPFHDDSNPSFSVSPEKNIAKCMSCGGGGRPINFYRQIKNVSFIDSVEELAGRIGIELNLKPRAVDPNNKYYEIMEEASNFYTFNLFNTKSGNDALKYLRDRNLYDDTIKEFKIGFASNEKDVLYKLLRDKEYNVSDMIDLGIVAQSNDGSYYDVFKNRILFPITNPRGRVVGFSGRTLEKTKSNKYINTQETIIFKKSELVYNINEATQSIKRSRHVVLYEGFFDVIVSSQNNFKNGIATMGTALTDQQARIIKSITDSVIIAFDGDNAGIAAAIKAVIPLEKAGLKVEILKLPNKLDPDDFIRQYGDNAYDRLFLESKYDPYAFMYLHYKEQTDFTNTNDLKSFKENVENALRNAPAPIKALYSKRLATDLGIKQDDVTIPIPKRVYEEPRDEVFVLPKKHQEKVLADKYEHAERRLIFLMMRSRTWFERIYSELNLSEYSNIENFSIRRKIKAYYDLEESFVMSKFKDTLSTDELSYLETILFNDFYWIEQKLLDSEEINKYVLLIKETPHVRRIAYLKERIVDLLNQKKSISLELEELDSLNKIVNKDKSGGK